MPSQIYPAVYPYASHSADSNYIYVSWSFPTGTSLGKVKILNYNTGAEIYNSGLLSRYTTSQYCYIPSPQWNVTGLYCVSVQVFNYDTGDFSPWSDAVYGYNRVTMDTSPPPVPTITSIVQSSRTLTHTVYFTKSGNATSVNISISGVGTFYNLTGSSLTFTASSYSTFSINAQANNSYGQTSSWSSNTYFTPTQPYPVPGLPTNISVSYSGMTATINWTNGTNATYTDVWNTNDGTHGTPTGTSWTFNVPSKGVSYYFRLASANPDNVSGWTDPILIYIAARPSNFYGSLYKTATDGNDVIDTAQWHAFATSINQFRAYVGLGQYSYSYLTNAQNGNDFMAIYFNEMLNSMNFCSGLPSNKNSGDSIYKSYFDNMVNGLNAVA
jgi:hypothetical protein